MSRYEADIITDWKELLANRMNQLLMITHGEVGAANRPSKDHIAHPRKLGLAVQEYYMPWGVPRAMDDL